jgi:hypothetical protein
MDCHGVSIMDQEELQKLFQELESWDFHLLPKKYGPYTASLVDEEDPDGLVEFKGKDGIARMWMPRADYDSIIKHQQRQI